MWIANPFVEHKETALSHEETLELIELSSYCYGPDGLGHVWPYYSMSFILLPISTQSPFCVILLIEYCISLYLSFNYERLPSRLSQDAWLWLLFLTCADRKVNTTLCSCV
jgi:hypothetical protein